MAAFTAQQTNEWTRSLSSERARVVGLCAHLTGQVAVAEDLAQETFLEAWRHRDKVYDAGGYSQWLSAIARNVCLRWLRQRDRDLHALSEPNQPVETGKNLSGLETQLVDSFDIEVELERRELAELIDRALSLLPPVTRNVLVERYILENPVAEVATRMGVSKGAVEMRLQRGKLALRNALVSSLRDEAASYGLVDVATDTWHETRIWCPLCGEHRLVGHFNSEIGELELRCPLCCREPGDVIWQASWLGLFDGVKGFKAAISRQMKWSNEYFRQGLLTGTVSCGQCSYSTELQLVTLTDVLPSMRGSLGLHTKCGRCGSSSCITHRGLVRCLPEVRHFWQQHPRMISLPEKQIEASGRAALVTSFRSVRDNAQLDVVSLRDDFRVISISSAGTNVLT